LPGDTEETISARIRRQEHRLYPMVVRWFGEGRVVETGRGIEVKGVPPAATLLFSAEP
jgi:phosphoribosylglycinamide formyltransferase-1